MEITFVRHTSVDVPQGICYGNTDVALKDSFEEEARQTLARLSGKRFDAVYSSPLSRARKLASFCGYADAEEDGRLIEYNFGNWEMQSYDRLYKEDAAFRFWCSHYLTERCPSGDSLSDQIERVKSFVNDMQQRGYERVCAFCHGGVIAIARSLAGLVSMEDSFREVPPYGSVVRLEF